MYETIETVVEFEAAHRLMNYRGKCNNLHGHNWKVDVSIYGEVDDHTGMVIDFAELKQLIVERFDHKVILNSADPLVRVLEDNNVKIVTIDGEPTCENIAKEIAEMILKVFKNIIWVTITVWENSRSKATIHKRPMNMWTISTSVPTSIQITQPALSDTGYTWSY